jgi:hypothetical protein
MLATVAGPGLLQHLTHVTWHSTAGHTAAVYAQQATSPMLSFAGGVLFITTLRRQQRQHLQQRTAPRRWCSSGPLLPATPAATVLLAQQQAAVSGQDAVGCGCRSSSFTWQAAAAAVHRYLKPSVHGIQLRSQHQHCTSCSRAAASCTPAMLFCCFWSATGAVRGLSMQGPVASEPQPPSCQHSCGLTVAGAEQQEGCM